ncbi:MAG: stage V sporulation protein AD [Eubacteriales bacterium]|nr:stage V sporulation protein AD [Eubacteriales bacterium]
MATKKGKQTIVFTAKPVIIGYGTVAGPKEGQGPVGSYFDKIYPDLAMGQKSFELAERQMMLNAIEIALEKASLSRSNVDFFVAGDLLNQIISSGFSALDLGASFLGIYGACSSFCEGLFLAGILVDSGAAQVVIAATSSHNNTAERQYRYPTEYGAQLPPWSQHTVTGAAATAVAVRGTGPRLELATVGKVMDLGIKDPMNMGAAMAPAAADTIFAHMADTGRKPEDYDLIVTGDLGKIGREILVELGQRQGVDLSSNYRDCGELIYSKEQLENAGGSGCACSALVTLGMLFNQNYKRILAVATGALHSPTSYQQGENIPAIAHAISIEF